MRDRKTHENTPSSAITEPEKSAIEKQEQNINHTVHDLNNIFTRILNSVELIKKRVEDDNELKPLLNSIENGTYLASEIMEDVIAETSGQKKRRRRKVDINNLINDLVSSVSVHFADRINISVKLDDEMQFVEGRYSDYYRVIMNLIINASEAIKEKGSIFISSQIAGSKKNEVPENINLFELAKFVEIKIKDDGIGIDKSVMPFIFDDNFTTKSKKKNSGYGLAIVKKIIDANNGSIKVNSEINKGTEFILRFPAVDIKSFDSSDRKKTILIAEDEDIQRLLLTELLESYNYKVHAVANGEKLIGKLAGDDYDLLIIDRQMPDMDGIECVKKIKAMGMYVPIILASGSQNQNWDLTEIENSVSRFISKPYNFGEMLEIIRELI
jgi:CheY-like chemotaxis protein/nitrogen-specific signal transduction histidine kinase